MKPSVKRARIEQKTKALRLLTLSGAIRCADIEARYRGSETVLGVASRTQPEAPRHQDSIWWMDLTTLLQAFKARERASGSRRTGVNQAAPLRGRMTKRLPAPRAA